MDERVTRYPIQFAKKAKINPADELSSFDPTQTADTTVLSRKVNRFRG
jgi:hypothetical protein